MRVTVIGSINTDIVISVDRLATPNETVIGRSDYVATQGGKGANQAVAAAAAGASVTMVGCVGSDIWGEAALADLESHGIDCRHVRVAAGASTGLASVIVDDHGNNMITVAPGANNHLSAKAVQAAEDSIAQSDVLLLQLEIPLATVEEAIRIARRHHVRVILNPAPPPVTLPAWLGEVDIVIPNQHEASVIGGGKGGAEENAAAMVEAGVGVAIVTLGKDGCLLSQSGRQQWIAPHAVDAVDTTGAGDTFCGFLAAQVAGGAAIGEAVVTANAAAAISVTRPSARSHVPKMDEVKRFMDQNRPARQQGGARV